jgi:hypothetical protein
MKIPQTPEEAAQLHQKQMAFRLAYSAKEAA